MPKITGSLVVGQTEQFVTLVIEGGDPPIIPIPSSHPNFDTIKSYVIDSAVDGTPIPEDVLDLTDIEKAVTDEFKRLSRRFSVVNGVIHFDNEAIDNTLADHVIRLLDAGESFESVVNFAEKLYSNPDVIATAEDDTVLAGNDPDRKRDDLVSQVFNWLRAEGLTTFTTEGNLVGYKGVQSDGKGGYTSINSGSAIVDGKKVTGRIPYAPGSTVEMPRGEVQRDPSKGCSTGLHVGTWSYASGFGRGETLEVHVDAGDIVSVRTECGAQKMRVSRLTVVGPVQSKYSTPVLSDEAQDDLEDTDWL